VRSPTVREGLAKLAGQVNAMRTRATAAAEEMARLSAAADEARHRATAAEAALDQLQAQVGRPLRGRGRRVDDLRHEAAVAPLTRAGRGPQA